MAYFAIFSSAAVSVRRVFVIISSLPKAVSSSAIVRFSLSPTSNLRLLLATLELTRI